MPINPRRLKTIHSRHYARGTKKVNVVVRVGRREQPRGGPAFVACAYPATGGWGHRNLGGSCATGRNPRKAMSGALHRIASKLTARSGAFAAFVGYSRKNRRVRRTRRGSKRRG